LKDGGNAASREIDAQCGALAFYEMLLGSAAGFAEAFSVAEAEEVGGCEEA
jgi:hypothetical protein